MRPSTHEVAETRYLELEASLCPRVIWDACEAAEQMTLEEMVESVRREHAG
jgi:hypothetical protein